VQLATAAAPPSMVLHETACRPHGRCALNLLCQRCQQCIEHCLCFANAVREFDPDIELTYSIRPRGGVR
jgi:hypothetical protein